MPLRFDKEATLSPRPDRVTFKAYDGNRPVFCEITREALTDIAGDHADDNAGLVAIFLQHQTRIEAAAAVWHESNGEPVVIDSQAIASRSP